MFLRIIQAPIKVNNKIDKTRNFVTLTLGNLADEVEFFVIQKCLRTFFSAYGVLFSQWGSESALSAAFLSNYSVIPGPRGSELHDPEDLQA